MPRTFFQNFTTDAGEPVTVEYFYEDGGSCACIKEAWREPEVEGGIAVEVNLTDDEDERMCAWIMEHRHWEDHAD